jgi:hypothetical protein
MLHVHVLGLCAQLERLERELMELKVSLSKSSGLLDPGATKRAIEADFMPQVWPLS